MSETRICECGGTMHHSKPFFQCEDCGEIVNDIGGRAKAMTLEDWFAGQATEEDIRPYLLSSMLAGACVPYLEATPEQVRPMHTRAKYDYAADMVAEKRRRENAK